MSWASRDIACVISNNMDMSSRELIDELTAILPPRSVLATPGELLPYELDGYAPGKARPMMAVFPATTEQVSAVVNILAARNIPIVPRGAGTGLAGGAVAFEDGIVVSAARMSRIVKIDLENRAAHVEAGVRNAQLSEALMQLPGGEAFHFGPDPTSFRSSTIGGNAAINAGGTRALTDFATANHVLGVELILPDGEIIEVGGKNGSYESAGFDLPGLICGSEGTLGIITKLWVRLSPKASAFRTILGAFAEVDDACQAAAEILTAGILPTAMELMTGRMVRLVDDAFHLGIPVGANAILLIEIEGIEELLDHRMSEIMEKCRQRRAITIETAADPEGRARLARSRKSVFGAIGRASHSYCTQDVCVPRGKLAGVLQGIDEIGRNHGVEIATLAHAADGNLHPVFLYDDRDPAQVTRTLAAIDEVLRFCIDIGGTFTGEHGVGLEKIGLMPLMFDAATLAQFDRVKMAFDPDRRMNAGKSIPDDAPPHRVVNPGRHVPQ